MASRISRAKGDKGVKSADKGENSFSCGNEIKDKELGVQCEVCDGWCHTKCENIKEEGYKVLVMENIHWYCLRCNKGIAKIVTSLIKVQKNQEKLDNEMVEVKKSQEVAKVSHIKIETEMSIWKEEVDKQGQELKRIQEEIKDMKSFIHQQQEEQKFFYRRRLEDSKWSTVVKKHVDKKMDVTGEMQEVQKTLVEAR